MDTSHEPLRIVMVIREPMGTLYQRAQEVIRQMGHRLVAVVTSAGPRTRRTIGYLDIVAQTPVSTDVIVSNYPTRWASVLAPFRPDLIVVLGFSWKLPVDVIELPRLGTINMHGALLPNYRGRGDWVLQWMFRNDEPEYGITYHRVDAGFDTGPILMKGPVPIGDEDDMMSLLSRAIDVAIDLLPQVIEMAARGEPGTPQEGGFYCEPMDPAWRLIDWNVPARAIHNQVRGWLGQGALATIDGVETRVIKSRLIGHSNGSAPPGTVLARDNGSLIVQCGDGPIQIIDLSPVG